MGFLQKEKKLITKNNHYIPQWLQKRYGLSFKYYNDVRPVILNKKTKIWHTAKNNKWETPTLFCLNKIYSQDLENYFGTFETKAALLFDNILSSNPYLKNLGIILKTSSPLEIILKSNKIFFFSNILQQSFITNENDSQQLAKFYTSLIQRYVLRNTIEDDYDNLTNILIEQTEKDFTNLNTKQYVEQYKSDITTKKGKTIRDISDAWHENSNMLINIKKFLTEEFLNKNYILIFSEIPLFFLGDNPFSLKNSDDNYDLNSFIKPLVLPVAHNCILVHKSCIHDNQNIQTLVYNYCYDTFNNSELLIFPIHETMNYWLNKFPNINKN